MRGLFLWLFCYLVRRLKEVVSLRFVFKIEPQSQLRPRASRRGCHVVVYDPPKVKAFKKRLAAMAREQYHGKPLSGPLVVSFIFYRPVQKSISKAERRRRIAGKVLPVVKTDLSNYLKATEDALNCILWADDNEIVEEHTYKRYSDMPRVEVEITRKDNINGR